MSFKGSYSHSTPNQKSGKNSLIKKMNPRDTIYKALCSRSDIVPNHKKRYVCFCGCFNQPSSKRLKFISHILRHISDSKLMQISNLSLFHFYSSRIIDIVPNVLLIQCTSYHNNNDNNNNNNNNNNKDNIINNNNNNENNNDSNDKNNNNNDNTNSSVNNSNDSSNDMISNNINLNINDFANNNNNVIINYDFDNDYEYNNGNNNNNQNNNSNYNNNGNNSNDDINNNNNNVYFKLKNFKAIIANTNNNEYSIYFLLNILKYIHYTRFSINAACKSLKSTQFVFFPFEYFSIPTHETIRRHLSSLSRTMDHIIKEKLKSSKSKLCLFIDESSYYLLINCSRTRMLSNDELLLKEGELNELKKKFQYNQNDEQLKKNIKQLERKVKFKYDFNNLSFGAFNLNGMTTSELKEKIDNTIGDLDINFMVGDNAKNINLIAKKNNYNLFNCFAHNINLVINHFINSLDSDFTNKLIKIIRILRKRWNFFSPLLSLYDFTESEFDLIFNSDDSVLEEIINGNDVYKIVSFLY